MPPLTPANEIRKPRSQAEVMAQRAPLPEVLAPALPGAGATESGGFFNPTPTMATQDAAQQALLQRVAGGQGQAPSLAAQPKPGIVKSLLTNFFSGMAEGFGVASGVPQLQQAQQRIDTNNRAVDVQEQAQERLERQLQLTKDLVETPWGPMPRDFATRLLQTSMVQQGLSGRQEDQQAFLGDQGDKNRALRDRLGSMAEEGRNTRAAQIRERMGSGVFIPLTNQRGEVTSFYNNRNPSLIMPASIEGLRRAGLPAEEFSTQAGMATVQGQMKKLEELSALKPDALGPAAGRWGKMKAEWLDGTITDPDLDAADMYQTADDIQNQLIYLRSGKQINEQEFKRLMATFPHTNLPPSTFGVRLKNFMQVFEEILGRRQSASPTEGVTKPSTTSPPKSKITFRKE